MWSALSPVRTLTTAYENSPLTKYKVSLVAHRFTQVSGVDYREAHLYAPVVRLESFHAFILIAALFDHNLCQFDVSAAHLHGDIDRGAYMEPPPGYEQEGIIWLLQKGLYGLNKGGW